MHKLFRLLARPVDGDCLLNGVDEPADFGAVRDPLQHLRIHLTRLVPRPVELNHEIRSKSSEAVFLPTSDGCPLLRAYQGDARPQHRSIG